MGLTLATPQRGGMTPQGNPSSKNPAAQLPPGTLIAREQSTSTPDPHEPEYGYFFEKLPQTVIAAIRKIFQEMQAESHQPRREEVRRIQQGREFWRGLHWQYWSAIDGQWHLPTQAAKSEQVAASDQPRYMFVTNYYQAFGLILVSVLSQDVPSVKLRPQSAQSDDDVETAKAGSDVIEIVQRNNPLPLLMADAAYYLFTDGKIGGYVRYVLDGERFGFHPEDEYETRQVKSGNDEYQCPCGAATIDDEDFAGSCEACGGELNQQHYSPAPLTMVPRVATTHKMPNGAEMITIVGGLELKTPSYCQDFWEYPYAIWDFEVHKARLKAAYPHARKKIAGAGSDAGQDENGTNERLARLSVQTGGNQGIPRGYGEQNLATYSRGWFRTWTYEIIEEDEEREFLYKTFPDGLFAAFSGGTDVFLEARNELISDHWRVMHALPGDGQDRPAMGTSFISVQERINTLDNLMIEKVEYGIPTTYANTNVLDFDSIPGTTIEPGATYPVTAPIGSDITKAFNTVEAAGPTEAEFKMRQDLSGPVGEFLTGAFPALFGADSGNDTVGGQVIQRDQAMGRLGVVWRRMKFFLCDLMLLSVDCFRKNRPDDVELPIENAAGDWKSKWIRKANLKGNLVCYPDSDEHYPATWSQQRETLEKLMASEDPTIQALLHHPENLEMVKSLIGLEKLVDPPQESRDKQYAEIEELLQSPPTPAPDPQTGQITLHSTVPIDPDCDDHATEWGTILRWLNSPIGREEKEQNPMGVANVRAHGLEHKAVLDSQKQGPEKKPPSESINFKDVPPAGQVQMAAQAGIHLDPVMMAAKAQQDHEKAKQEGQQDLMDRSVARHVKMKPPAKPQAAAAGAQK